MQVYRTFTGLSTLDLEIMKSEYQRSFVLIFLFVLGLLVVIINFFLLDASMAEFYGGATVYFISVLWLIVVLLYEVAVLQFLKRKIDLRQKVSTQFKFVHTFIEVSFPSAIMAYMVFSYNMLSFMDSPIVNMYFLFVILSILHVDFRISIFTGILAGLQYATIVYLGFRYGHPLDVYMPSNPENSFYIRTIIFMLSSMAAGFVAYELKNRITASFESKKAKDEIELLFDQQVSKEVSKTLIENKAVTKRLEATVMFLDIRNFTAFADAHTPDEVIDYQNKFIAPVIDIINRHQGVVFQILGDGLMACFGSPVENILHADMAFQSSLEILKKVKQMSDEDEIPTTRIGIGLHSGQVITGNIGNEQRKQFSISGSPVIVASRLEQLNKKFNTELLVSQEVVDRIRPAKIEVTFVMEETLRGIGIPIKVYKVH